VPWARVKAAAAHAWRLKRNQRKKKINPESRGIIVVLIAPRMRTRLANRQPSLDVDGAFTAADLDAVQRQIRKRERSLS
jgi:hypothetical protein